MNQARHKHQGCCWHQQLHSAQFSIDCLFSINQCLDFRFLSIISNAGYTVTDWRCCAIELFPRKSFTWRSCSSSVELTPGLAVHVYFYHKLYIHLYIKPKMRTRAVLRSLNNSDSPQNKMGRHADQVSSWAYFEAESKASHFLSMVDTPKKSKKSTNNFEMHRWQYSDWSETY